MPTRLLASFVAFAWLAACGSDEAGEPARTPPAASAKIEPKPEPSAEPIAPEPEPVGETGSDRDPEGAALPPSQPAPVEPPSKTRKSTTSTKYIDCVRDCTKTNPLAELDQAAARADCEHTCK
jgi:hypothetical protein